MFSAIGFEDSRPKRGYLNRPFVRFFLHTNITIIQSYESKKNLIYYFEPRSTLFLLKIMQHTFPSISEEIRLSMCLLIPQNDFLHRSEEHTSELQSRQYL